MMTGVFASLGAWVPTLAVYQNHQTTTETPNPEKAEYLGSSPWLFGNALRSSSLAVHLMKQEEGGGARELALGRGRTFQLPQSLDHVC